jgi:hypothetical protein
MPKVKRGRLDGLSGMTTFTAEELFRWSAKYETRVNRSPPPGHPNWLKRRAVRLAKLAASKDKMRVHREQQKRRNAHRVVRVPDLSELLGSQ